MRVMGSGICGISRFWGVVVIVMASSGCEDVRFWLKGSGDNDG